MHALLGSLALSLFPVLRPLPQQEARPDVLEQRAREVAAMISAEPRWPEELFDPAFLAQVPPAQLRAIGRQFHGACGPLVELQQTERSGAFSGKFDLILEKQQVVPMTLGLSETPPHAVVALWFGSPSPLLAEVGAAVAELAKLPGALGFALWKLGGEEPEVLAALEPERPLAIGSAFKLYLLGALADELAAGERSLGELVTLEARHRSLPSGLMQDWPLGLPVTVGTLAAQMISLSDNTATDHLLALLGRARVEAQLEPMGNRHAELDRPLLATNELFRLKLTRGGALAEQYLALEPQARAEWLERTLPSVPLAPETIDQGAFARPNRIERIEWFASAADLCRALDWLRVHAAEGEAATLREVLTIRRGLDVSRELFPWCGFKGGSEPGVLALCFLLRHAEGEWFACALVWNDPADNVEEARLLALAQRTLYVLGTTRPKPTR